jgi:ABC-2 type transport system permease protein
VLAAVSLFLASLTGRRAFATGAVAIFFLLTYTLAEILLQVENHGIRQQQAQSIQNAGHFVAPAVPMAEKVSGLFSPFTLFDGVRMWLSGHGTGQSDNVLYPGSFGAVYALVLVVLLAACLTGLFARYRKAARLS